MYHSITSRRMGVLMDLVCSSLFIALALPVAALPDTHELPWSKIRPAASAGSSSFRSAASTSSSFGLELSIDKNSGNYSLSVGGTVWLQSAPTFFTVKGKRYSSSTGGGLKLVEVYSVDGSDALGPWNATAIVYHPDDQDIDITVAFKQYLFVPNIVIFGQVFGDDIPGSSTGNRNNVCTGFPSFMIDKPSEDKRLKFRKHRPGKKLKPELGYLAYGGIMFGDTSKKIGRWNSHDVTKISSGLDSGPLVLFDSSSQDALVLSAFSQFMSLSTVYSEMEGSMSVSWGLMGKTERIPGVNRFWTIASYSSEGINRGIERWGEILRAYYRRGTEYRDSDLTNNYIGFWTDNGAYYYYKTEPGMDYESTILSEARYSSNQGIPYRYIQYDSWFYYKGSDNGVKEWTAMPTIFPRGMQYVWNKTGLTVVAHNRWWSYDTVYAKQHGGKYDFIVESESKKALPVDQNFWDDLLRESRKWGLIVYEQDWLNDQFDLMNATVSDVFLGRKWLLQMGNGARKNGLTIQYCMAPSRHALESLEIPVVSQARVSNDYQPGNDQWKIGISSMFAHALGVAPFKDNFWTTTNQPGNPYNRTEPYPELQSIVATLSTGPVAPSDRIGYSDKQLIMRSCNSDGLILKPSRPATSLDNQIKQTAFGKFSCELWSTYSEISGWFFGIVFAADCKHNEKIILTPKEAGFGPSMFDSVIYSWYEPEKTFPFSESSPLILTGCRKDPFCLYLSSPVISRGDKKIILYGELNKWVSMSPKRVKQIHTVEGSIDGAYVALQGASEEHITFSYSVDGVMKHVECVLFPDGTGGIDLPAGNCVS